MRITGLTVWVIGVVRTCTEPAGPQRTDHKRVRGYLVGIIQGSLREPPCKKPEQLPRRNVPFS